jgi:phosphatidylinositol glycan class B
MVFPRESGYRKWLIIGLIVQVIAAWFSVGFHHPDEHFQVLEFCNNKLGYSPAADLPWEYGAQCRSSIPPYIALEVCRVLNVLGLYSPFMAAFLLRLIMGVATWWLACRMISTLISDFATDQGKKLFVLCSFLLWFVPYIGVRFSSENIAGILFFFAITLLLRMDSPLRKSFPKLMLAGLLMGIALYIRLQMGFAFIGLAIWLLFIRKSNWSALFTLASFILVGCAISIVPDRFFYGKWVLTPLNYFVVNIVEHKAAACGVSPWWDYFWMFFQLAVPPISLVLLLSFFTGIFKKPLHLLSIICIFMIIGHMMISHKEMRFLFPLFFAFIFLVCQGMEVLLLKYRGRRWYGGLFPVLLVVNVLLLTVKIFTPAQEAIGYYDCLYGLHTDKNTTFVSLEKSPYKLVDVELNFYKPQGLTINVLPDKSRLDSLLKKKDEGKGSYIVLSPKNIGDNELTGYSVEKLYCPFPNWLLRFNFFDWQSRSNIWTIYRVHPKAS